MIIGILYFALPFNLLVHGVNKLSESNSDQSWLVFWILLENFPFLVFLMWASPSSAGLWLAALVLAAIAYGQKAIQLKSIPIIDALTWSFLRSSPLVYAFLLGSWRSEFLAFTIAFFMWGIAAATFESIKSRQVDKDVGINTTATWVGIKRSTVLTVLLFTAATIITIVNLDGWWKLAGVASLLYPLNAARFLGVKNPELFEMGWKAFLKLNYFMGGSLLLAVLVFAF